MEDPLLESRQGGANNYLYSCFYDLFTVKYCENFTHEISKSVMWVSIRWSILKTGQYLFHFFPLTARLVTAVSIFSCWCVVVPQFIIFFVRPLFPPTGGAPMYYEWTPNDISLFVDIQNTFSRDCLSVTLKLNYGDATILFTTLLSSLRLLFWGVSRFPVQSLLFTPKSLLFTPISRAT